MPNRTDSTPYRLVALDIDGTVLNSAQEVTPELKEELAGLAERGVRTVLCTGRRWRSTIGVLEEMQHAHPVVVCCGGALIKNADDERTLHAVPMEHATARLVCGLFRQAGLVPMLLYDRPLAGRELKLCESDRMAAERLPYVQENPDAVEWYSGDYPGADELPLMAYTVDLRAKVDAVEELIRQGVGPRGIVEALHQLRYGSEQGMLEVHAPAVTKWRALEWLLEQWGMRAEEVVAIGDDVNDIEMLRAAGLSFAMGNASDEVKAAADEVTGSNDEHGVAAALSSVFER
jgi:Cof subfamily protein (haloacid dehalogenase superfamily)